MKFKDCITHTTDSHIGIGSTLRLKRIAQGLSIFKLSHELNLDISIIEAIENEDWSRLPPGREIPYTRLIAERLGIDLDLFLKHWGKLPETPEYFVNTNRKSMERILVNTIMVCSLIILFFWLITPGSNFDTKHASSTDLKNLANNTSNLTINDWIKKKSISPYPVIGEMLPETPINSNGILVRISASNICTVTIKQCADIRKPNFYSEQKINISDKEVYRLRVKGPFVIFINNAGVVYIEIAGRQITHGRTIGESWNGKFKANGELFIPSEMQTKNTSNAPEVNSQYIEIEQSILKEDLDHIL